MHQARRHWWIGAGGLLLCDVDTVNVCIGGSMRKLDTRPLDPPYVYSHVTNFKSNGSTSRFPASPPSIVRLTRAPK